MVLQESRYAEALQNANCTSASGELELLRLMQRTGSAWADLSPETADGLLSTMVKLLHERTAIPRILPWLKELAHPSCTLLIPQNTRRALLAALASVPAGEDAANKGRVSSLVLQNLCCRRSAPQPGCGRGDLGRKDP